MLRKLLCNPVGSPPPGIVDGTKNVTDPNATMRDRLAAHRTSAVCATCHQFIDPIGLSFENFDAVGRWHDNEPGGAPVDATGALTRSDLDGPVHDALELTQKLAQSAQVSTMSRGELVQLRERARPGTRRWLLDHARFGDPGEVRR